MLRNDVGLPPSFVYKPRPSLICTSFRYLAVRSSSTPSAASATVSRVSNVGGSGGHCGLEIVGVEDRDRGRWECEVGAVINDDFKTKTDNIVLDVKSKLYLIVSCMGKPSCDSSHYQERRAQCNCEIVTTPTP